MKPLSDYSNRCGLCRNFDFIVVKGQIRHWGRCNLKDRSNYHQASQKACQKYVEVEQ